MKEVVQGLRITVEIKETKTSDHITARLEQCVQFGVWRDDQTHHNTSSRQVPSSSSMSARRRRKRRNIVKNTKTGLRGQCNDIIKCC